MLVWSMQSKHVFSTDWGPGTTGSHKEYQDFSQGYGFDYIGIGQQFDEIILKVSSKLDQVILFDVSGVRLPCFKVPYLAFVFCKIGGQQTGCRPLGPFWNVLLFTWI